MTEPSEHQDVEQPLVQHLIELRDRLLRCILIVLLVFAGLFYFANDIYTFVAAPLQKFPSRRRRHDCHRGGRSLFNAF